MKVLKDNYNEIATIATNTTNKPYPRELVCENCGSSLEYDEPDLRMGVYGCMHIDCPLCGYGNMIDDNENNTTLTVDNIEFPTHFYHVSKETGAVDICNNECVKEYLHKAIDYFRANKEAYDWGSWITANLYIHVHRYSDDEEYDVIVSNNFYNIHIPFEPEDY